MLGSNPQPSRQVLIATALALVALATLAVLAGERQSLARISGDEATYIAMAESLAVDLDLEFGEEDEARIVGDANPGRRTVILQRTPRGISYSKPFLPALVVAPFYALFGPRGTIFANLLLLTAALAVAWLYLRRLGGRGPAALTLVTFAATGALLPYVLWQTSDALQAALALSGLTLCLGGLRSSDRRGGLGLLDRSWSLWIGAALLGLLIALRPPNLLVAVVAPVALVVAGRRKEGITVSVVLAVMLALVAAAGWFFTGSAMPYKAERATFNQETGYPAGDDGEEVAKQFEIGRATSSLGAVPDLEPRVSAYASLSFLIGRHTGVLIYFPALAFLLWTAVRAADRTAAVVLAGVLLASLFYLLWLPFNYFGGGSCVGNRYFLASYAALPLALTRPLGRWSVVGCWLLAVAVAVSAIHSVRLIPESERTSQSHAHAGIFRLLPYETTASDLEGSRDHYFGKDFVRSVDPFIASGGSIFRLRSGQPAGELLLANLEADEPLRLLVHSGTPRIMLDYSDYGTKRTFELEKPLGLRGLVEILPSKPLRYHPLWFRNVWDHGRPYWVRVFRLAVRSADGSPVEATVRFLGQETFPPPVFERTVVTAELPSSVAADSISRVTIRVRNDSGRVWRSDGLFPVFLSYRLERLGEGEKTLLEGSRSRLPAEIKPGEELAMPVKIRWPSAPGAYRTRVDLVVEGVAWFEDLAGAPLAGGVVEIAVETEEHTDAE